MVKPAVVVVTGGTAGVGRATVRRFARDGASIGMLAREPRRLRRAAQELEDEYGVRALGIPTDVADAGEVDDAAAQVESELGPIDVWVNNAMTSVFAPFASVEPDEFERVTAVTYLGCVYGTRAALRRMRQRDRGVIVQVGSALAYRGIPLQSAYCGAKHAIRGFTESVRCELMHEGSHVRIGIVHLPAVNTPQFEWVLSRLPRRAQPVPPIFSPELAADAIAHLAYHPRRELWAGFATVKTVLAEALAPGLLDRYLARRGERLQQTDEPEWPHPANLWEPVPGGFAAAGHFGDRAKHRSPAIWVSKHRRALLAAGTAGAAAAAAFLFRDD